MATQAEAREKKTSYSKEASTKLREALTARVVAALEAGTVPWRKPWVGGTPFNPATGAKGYEYNGGNALWLTMIAMEKGWSDPRWMTKAQSERLGYAIAEGTESHTVEYWKPPSPYTKKEEMTNVVTGNTEEVEVTKMSGWRVFTAEVFNAHQILAPVKDAEGKVIAKLDGDGKPVTYEVRIGKGEAKAFPEPAERKPLAEIEPFQRDAKAFSPVERAEQMIAAMGATVKHGGDRAFYSPMLDYIQVPQPTAFKSPEDYYGTLLHEHAHWSGAPMRVKDDKGEPRWPEGRESIKARAPFGSELYAKEELRAELASVFLTQEVGVALPDEHFENHAAYLQSWVKALKENKNEIFAAAKDAHYIADGLLDIAAERMIDLSLEYEETLAQETTIQVGAEREGAAEPPRDRAAEERMWIGGRAQSLVKQGLDPVDASMQATWEMQQYAKAEAEGLSQDEAWKRVTEAWARISGTTRDGEGARESVPMPAPQAQGRWTVKDGYLTLTPHEGVALTVGSYNSAVVVSLRDAGPKAIEYTFGMTHAPEFGRSDVGPLRYALGEQEDASARAEIASGGRIRATLRDPLDAVPRGVDATLQVQTNDFGTRLITVNGAELPQFIVTLSRQDAIAFSQAVVLANDEERAAFAREQNAREVEPRENVRDAVSAREYAGNAVSSMYLGGEEPTVQSWASSLHEIGGRFDAPQHPALTGLANVMHGIGATNLTDEQLAVLVAETLTFVENEPAPDYDRRVHLRSGVALVEATEGHNLPRADREMIATALSRYDIGFNHDLGALLETHNGKALEAEIAHESRDVSRDSDDSNELENDDDSLGIAG